MRPTACNSGWRLFCAWLVGSLLGCALTGIWLHSLLLLNVCVGVALLTYAMTPEPSPPAARRT